MVNEGDDVEFYGQVLFAVAATTYNLARKAARLAHVDYETDKPDLTIEQGWAKQSFVRPSHRQQCGDSELALAEAECHLKGELQKSVVKSKCTWKARPHCAFQQKKGNVGTHFWPESFRGTKALAEGAGCTHESGDCRCETHGGCFWW